MWEAVVELIPKNLVDGFCAVIYVEFLVNAMDMFFNCAFGDTKHGGNLFI